MSGHHRGNGHLKAGYGGRIPRYIEPVSQGSIIADRLAEEGRKATEARLAKAAERKAFLAPRKFSWEGKA